MLSSSAKKTNVLRCTFVSLVLGALTTIASGCSNAGNGTPLPQSGANGSSLGSALNPFRDRVKITQFADLPQYSDAYSPSAIASAGGSLWVADTIDQDYGENVIVQIGTSGNMMNAYYYPGRSTEGASFQDIAYGSDGALWITDYYNEQIVRMTLQGAYTNFPLAGFTAPYGICSGPDKALWFTAYSSGSGSPVIGRLTTKGKVTIYPTTLDAFYIAAGSDGALWFTAPRANAIGRITTDGKVTEYTKGISSGAGVNDIAPGPDGALWFTENTGGRIGRITTRGRVTEYSNGITPTEMPEGLAAGPDHAMSFTESEPYGSYRLHNSKIGHITMRGKIAEYSKGINSQAGPTAIVLGPDNNMWFAETSIDETGRVTL